MANLQIGDKAPDFSLLAQDGKTYSLADFAGKTLVLYFYPKDDTSGCTAQACEFNEKLQMFYDKDAVVIGLSKDPIKKHEKFAAKYDLTFPLLSDETTQTCIDYDVLKEKSMYGKKYMGIERSTFVIDGTGKIKEMWRKVKVPGHVDTVLESL